MDSVVDNDILLKGTCYQILDLLLVTASGQSPGVLGQARYVVRSRLVKKPPSQGAAAAIELFEHTLSGLKVIEPDAGEIQLAAEYESIANQLGVDLDAGESQLAAVSVLRGLNNFLTGDKRGILALQRLLDNSAPNLSKLTNQVTCLEQGVLLILKNALMSPANARARICSNKNTDAALTICFSCSSPEVSPERCIEGLISYVANLKKEAPQILRDI